MRIAALAGALALAASVVGGPGAAAPSTALFISEYVEGSGLNKALEIYNGTGAPVDLGAYGLEFYDNGSGTPSQINLGPGTLADGDVWVVTNNSATAALRALADQQSPTVDFNGNDAIRLISAGFVRDMIGQVGFDPGLAWGVDPTDTLNSTLRRNGTVTDGDTNSFDAFDPALEWTGYPVDTFDGLGWHSVVQDTGSVSTTVTVAVSAACLELSATSASFGTLALGAENQPATPDITVTNCSGSAGTLLASGTDATGPGALWTLDDTSQTCTGSPALGLDRYHLFVAPAGLPAVSLSSASKTVQTLAAGASNAHTLRISTACPGSSGAGRTMSQQVDYTATG